MPLLIRGRDMRQDIGSNPVDCLLPLGQNLRKSMPYVEHLGPHFEFDFDARRLRAFRQPRRIVQ